MWVVVADVVGDGYIGVLDSHPGSSHAAVQRGSMIPFTAEHICDIDAGPPPDVFDDLMRAAREDGGAS
jgi:hypothetical protein